MKHVVLDEAARDLALRIVLLWTAGVRRPPRLRPRAHGLSIDVGAHRQGAQRSRTRALRFGLYACGWDPRDRPPRSGGARGEEGAAAALSLTGLGAGLPTRATETRSSEAATTGPGEARRALGTSYVGAAIATLLGAFLVLAAIVVVLVS